MNLNTRLLAVASICLSLAAVTHAEPVSQLRPTDYVNDFAHVLDQNAIVPLDDICLQIDEKAHAQIAVVTINSLDGSDIESYAVDLFKKWGIGSKSTNRGVLILYAIRDRRSRIEVGYGLEPILPDGKVGSFQREAIPLMQRGDYNAALTLVTSRVADVIAKDAGIELNASRPRAPTEPASQPQGGMSIVEIVGIIVVILIVLFTPLRNILFWLIFSQVFGGRGSGESGGGNFGGSFGGGGGFGGFGGGSSGGGGASSSW